MHTPLKRWEIAEGSELWEWTIQTIEPLSVLLLHSELSAPARGGNQTKASNWRRHFTLVIQLYHVAKGKTALRSLLPPRRSCIISDHYDLEQVSAWIHLFYIYLYIINFVPRQHIVHTNIKMFCCSSMKSDDSSGAVESPLSVNVWYATKWSPTHGAQEHTRSVWIPSEGLSNPCCSLVQGFFYPSLLIQVLFIFFLLSCFNGFKCVLTEGRLMALNPERWHTVTWFTPTQNVTLSTLSEHFLTANIITIIIIIKLF